MAVPQGQRRKYLIVKHLQILFFCLCNFKSKSGVLLWRAMLRKMLIGRFKIHQQDFVAWNVFLLASNKRLSVFRYCSVTSEIVLYFMRLSYFHYQDWLTPNCRALSCFPHVAAWHLTAPFPGSCWALQRGSALPASWGSSPASWACHRTPP